MTWTSATSSDVANPSEERRETSRTEDLVRTHSKNHKSTDNKKHTEDTGREDRDMAKRDKKTGATCKNCGSSNLVPAEARAAKESGSQRMKCSDCGFEFLVESSNRKSRKILG